jgi:chemotaxis protein MotA
MAEPSQGKTGPAALPAQKPQAQAGRRPDLSTLAGISIALAGIIGGLLLEKGSIADVSQSTAALIVLGGTIGAVLVTTPMAVFLRAVRALSGVVMEPANTVQAAIDQLIHFATRARKNGIVSLETETAAIPDPFLRKALNLAVDGTDLQELRKIMDTEIGLREQAGESEAKVWEAAGGYAPTIGIIGAVMGLIQVMKHLEDIKEVGRGIAVAFVATVYGVGAANILFLPVASKLKARLHEATLVREMILEGVVGIVEGLNPTLIRIKLESYDLEAAGRAKAKAKPKAGAAPEAPAKPGGPRAVAGGGGRG